MELLRSGVGGTVITLSIFDYLEEIIPVLSIVDVFDTGELFELGLVFGTTDPGGNHRDAIMGSHLLASRVDVRFIAVRFVHPAF